MEQQSKYRVIVSERATQMLVSHVAFLAQTSPEAAERLTVEFEKTAHSLEVMPQRCPWLTGEYIPRKAYRFILFEKRYMIIFQIDRITIGSFNNNRIIITPKTSPPPVTFFLSIKNPPWQVTDW